MKQVSMDELSAPLEEAVTAAGGDPRKAFKAELRKEPLTDVDWLVLLYELLKQKIMRRESAGKAVDEAVRNGDGIDQFRERLSSAIGRFTHSKAIRHRRLIESTEAAAKIAYPDPRAPSVDLEVNESSERLVIRATVKCRTYRLGPIATLAILQARRELAQLQAREPASPENPLN